MRRAAAAALLATLAGCGVTAPAPPGIGAVSSAAALGGTPFTATVRASIPNITADDTTLQRAGERICAALAGASSQSEIAAAAASVGLADGGTLASIAVATICPDRDEALDGLG